MAAVATISDVYAISKDNKLFRVYGTIALSGSYAGSPGDTLNLATATWPVGQGPIPTSSAPIQLTAVSSPASSAAASGYVYFYAKGSDMTNGKFQVFQSAGSAAALAQLSGGAYPAGASGDTITFEAIFKAV